MRHPFKTGFSFGITSAIITTLGLIVGLHAGTGSRLAVLGGIITIAVADAFSDALGIHISEESEGKHSSREVWEATISTFVSKFIFASLFIVPILLFELNTAIWASVIMGMILLAALSVRVKADHISHSRVVTEHVGIALVVVLVAHYVGEAIHVVFG